MVLETFAAYETIWASGVEEDLDFFRVIFPELINVGLSLFEFCAEIDTEAFGDLDLLIPDGDRH